MKAREKKIKIRKKIVPHQNTKANISEAQIKHISLSYRSIINKTKATKKKKLKISKQKNKPQTINTKLNYAVPL